MRAGGKHRPETRGPTTRTGTETSPGSQASEELGVVEKLLSKGERIVRPEGRHKKYDGEPRDGG